MRIHPAATMTATNNTSPSTLERRLLMSLMGGFSLRRRGGGTESLHDGFDPHAARVLKHQGQREALTFFEWLREVDEHDVQPSGLEPHPPLGGHVYRQDLTHLHETADGRHRMHFHVLRDRCFDT